ncbi:MAG: hypothetical protein KC912_26740, partial [Proteobacteria bacterium]|nr:hypothetical protein [Pseudomonadota bacterium]
MRSLFLRVVLGMLIAVAFGLGANSVVLFRMSREAPALIVEMHEEQLKLVAEQVELAQSPEEARHVARRLAPAMRLPIRLFEPGDPIPPDFSRVQLTSGQILAAPPPPGPPPWGWTLALQSLVVLLGVGVVAWALTAPLLGDLRRLELAVGAFRD